MHVRKLSTQELGGPAGGRDEDDIGGHNTHLSFGDIEQLVAVIARSVAIGVDLELAPVAPLTRRARGILSAAIGADTAMHPKLPTPAKSR